MPRYIDAEKIVIEEFPLKDHELIKVNECAFFGRRNGKAIMQIKDYLKRMIDNIPSADVVPRSEVEELKAELEAMRGAANSYKLHYEKAKQEVAMEILGDIYDLSKHSRKDMRITYSDFDELRKKYIGEKKNV